MANEIPVYLFVGFLESGKTKFIQETFEDPNFDSGDKTLLLICEEGEEEYNREEVRLPRRDRRQVLEDKSELNPQNLAKLGKEADAGRVVIEYNGMWLLQDLADALPENWLVYQCIATADGTTALTYARDNSMRSLMLDKIARSELIVFNRAEAVNNDDARQELHKLVRQASRKCDIAYEFKDGSVAYDDIPDPLPFDINADRSSTSRMTISASGIWIVRTSPRSTPARPCGSWHRSARPTAPARTALCPAASP